MQQNRRLHKKVMEEILTTNRDITDDTLTEYSSFRFTLQLMHKVTAISLY